MPDAEQLRQAGTLRSTRVLPWLLVAYVGMVIYLTTYPWNFNFTRAGTMLSWRLDPGRAAFVDLVLNFLLLMPLGLLAAFLGRFSWKAWLVVPAAMLLSVSIELAQAFIPGRTSSTLDLIANSLGCTVGLLIGLGIETWREELPAHQRDRSAASTAVDFRGLWLVLVFLTGYLFPFIPSYRLIQLRDAWARLWQVPDLLPLFTSFVTVMLLASVLRRTTRPELPRAMLLCLIPLLLLVGFLFPGRSWPLPAMAAGMLGAGLALWLPAGRSAPWLPLLAIVYLCVRQLSPFDFSASGQPFSWVPFASVLQIPQASAVRIVAEKLFLYAATLSCLWRYLGLLWPSAILIATLLAIGEWAQLWIPGRVPDILDPLLVLFAATLLRLLPGLPVKGIFTADRKPTPV